MVNFLKFVDMVSIEESFLQLGMDKRSTTNNRENFIRTMTLDTILTKLHLIYSQDYHAWFEIWHGIKTLTLQKE